MIGIKVEEAQDVSSLVSKNLEIYNDKICEILQKIINKRQNKVLKSKDREICNTEESNLVLVLENITNELPKIKKIYPNVSSRIELYINGFNRFRDNMYNKDTRRIIAGGELKTLIRNVLEPMVNFALSLKTTRIETISVIMSSAVCRSNLIMKYNIVPEELNAVKILYNYSNGCDHILDARNKDEELKNKKYLEDFEKLAEIQKENICIDFINVMKKIFTDEEILKKMENLIMCL